MPKLTAAEWLTIIAILLGPILAVQAQQVVERLREAHRRKMHIFVTLMGTRAARLSPDHVQALNMIDIEFYGSKLFWWRWQGSKSKSVVDAWRAYLDHLSQDIPPDAGAVLSVKRDDLFTELLLQMSVALGYNFDAVHLKRAIYSPRAHGQREVEEQQMRENLNAVLSGRTALKMDVTGDAETLQGVKSTQDAIIKAVSGSQPVRVEIVEKDDGGLRRGPR